MTYTLRDYQQASVDGIFSSFKNQMARPLIVLPTGTGKSIVVADFIKTAIAKVPHARILMLTHVKELVEQNAEKLVSLWPEVPLGICCAGMKRKELGRQVTMGSIQSTHRKADQIGFVDVVIIDEAHLIPAKGNTMYQSLLAKLRERNERLKVVGLTATDYRLDSNALHGYEGALFDGVAYEMSIGEAVDAGWICEPVPVRTKTELDVDGVGKRGGEFIPGQLAKAVDLPETTRAAVEEVIKHGADRQSWLLFCAGVEHALKVRNALRAQGITCEAVTGDTPKDERERIIEMFKAGKIKALTNMNVLTTGFDAPAVDLVALLRPTMSPGLLVQMVGRGTRLSPGKDNCLVLDFAKNFARHGVLDDISEQMRKKGRKTKGSGDAVIKECPGCAAPLFGGVMLCPYCGHKFERAPEISKTASDAPILKKHEQDTTQVFEVDNVVYAQHLGASGIPTLKATYVCGVISINEFICLEHSGYPRRKAEAWWERRSSRLAPATVSGALPYTDELLRPRYLRAIKNGKYWNVDAYSFETQKEGAA